MTTVERREQLRLAKQAQRKRDKNARRKMNPEAGAQLTLTLSSGDKAILAELVTMGEGSSMSEILVNLLHKHPKYRQAKARLPGLFLQG